MEEANSTEGRTVLPLGRTEAGRRCRICEGFGIIETAFARCEKKFRGRGVLKLRKLNRLRERSRLLKGLATDLTVDRQVL